LNGFSGTDSENLVFEVQHDGNVDIYLNGVIACEKEYNSQNYVICHINQAALQALNPGGENVIAIHCNKKRGNKFIDVGLSLLTK
jgi:hypothetical protein